MEIYIPKWIFWTIVTAVGFPFVAFILMCTFIGFMYVAHDIPILKNLFK